MRDEIVYDKDGNAIKFEDAMDNMDEEILEAVSEEYAPCSPQRFFDAYCAKHYAAYGEKFTIN